MRSWKHPRASPTSQRGFFSGHCPVGRLLHVLRSFFAYGRRWGTRKDGTRPEMDVHGSESVKLPTQMKMKIESWEIGQSGNFFLAPNFAGRGSCSDMVLGGTS